MAETGWPPIPTGWADINKGDSLRPNYRRRLVCQETPGRSTTDVEDCAAMSAATPPYEALNLLMLWDISRAHLHSPLARAVFVTILRDH